TATLSDVLISDIRGDPRLQAGTGVGVFEAGSLVLERARIERVTQTAIGFAKTCDQSHPVACIGAKLRDVEVRESGQGMRGEFVTLDGQRLAFDELGNGLELWAQTRSTLSDLSVRMKADADASYAALRVTNLVAAAIVSRFRLEGQAV